MKNLMKGFTLLLMLGLTITVFGQHRGPHGGGHGLQMIEEFKADLKLTPEQETQLTALEAKGKAAMENLKATDYEDPADRRTAMHELMQQQKAAVQEILTTEQQALLKEKMKAMRDAQKERMDKVDHKALKQEMQQYHETNVLPTLRAQRAKLDSKISAEDKATIADLRIKIEAAKAKRKEMKKEKGPHEKGDHKGLKEEQKPEREQVKALVEKYQSDIEALLAEIAPQKEQWRTDKQAIAEKYRPEAPEGATPDQRKGKGKGKHEGGHHRDFGKMRLGHFLLLDPNAEAATPAPGTGQAWTKVRTYPNPAVNSNQLDYTVVKTGQIRIELHNDSGTLVKLLLNESKTPGDYSLSVDFGNLRSGSYYLIVKDQGGVSSQKVVVAK